MHASTWAPTCRTRRLAPRSQRPSSAPSSAFRPTTRPKVAGMLGCACGWMWCEGAACRGVTRTKMSVERQGGGTGAEGPQVGVGAIPAKAPCHGSHPPSNETHTPPPTPVTCAITRPDALAHSQAHSLAHSDSLSHTPPPVTRVVIYLRHHQARRAGQQEGERAQEQGGALHDLHEPVRGFGGWQVSKVSSST